MNILIAGDTRDAIAASDIIVIATPYQASLEVARRLGPALAGKTVVDISNPLNEAYSELVTPPGRCSTSSSPVTTRRRRARWPSS